MVASKVTNIHEKKGAGRGPLVFQQHLFLTLKQMENRKP